MCVMRDLIEPKGAGPCSEKARNVMRKWEIPIWDAVWSLIMRTGLMEFSDDRDLHNCIQNMFINPKTENQLYTFTHLIFKRSDEKQRFYSAGCCYTCFTSAPSTNSISNCPTNLDVIAFVEFVKERDSCSYNEAIRKVAVSMDAWHQSKNQYKLEK